jgi:hypothetical protein
VGRWILMFVPDPVAVVRAASRLVRPGGTIAFHEVWWGPVLQTGAALPLGSKALGLLHDTIVGAGANPSMGPALRGVFRDAGLPEPTMRLEMMMEGDRECAQWIVDTLQSVLPQVDLSDPRLSALGDFASLPEKIEAEISALRSPAPWLAMVGAWGRKTG